MVIQIHQASAGGPASRAINLALWLALALQTPPARATPAEEAEAVAAVKAWLQIVDAGHYEEAWQSCAGPFRIAVPKATFMRQLKDVREMLGQVTSRKVSTQSAATSVPTGPPGQYVIVELKTDFTKRTGLTERVTPMLDRDGKWRVSGYFFV